MSNLATFATQFHQNVENLSENILETLILEADGVRHDLANLGNIPANQRPEALEQIAQRLVIATQKSEIAYTNVISILENQVKLRDKMQTIANDVQELTRSLEKSRTIFIDKTTSCGKKALNYVGSFLLWAGRGTYHLLENLRGRIFAPLHAVDHAHRA